jgi:UDP-N-acetyl-D-glucosamine dehydrogenase
LSAEELKARLEAKEALIGVIGLGYVGLPLSLAFGEAGARVMGFDLDPEKVDAINDGRTYLEQYSASRVSNLVKYGRLSATSDMALLGKADVLLICVPTPLTKHLEPDLTYVERTVEAIAGSLRKGQLIVLESTTYPGTTRELVQPILEKTGLIAGKDFWLAFSPEREDPGNKSHTTTSIPKVVGADDADSRQLAVSAYSIFSTHVVPVVSSATAEAVKITENIFRAVNIALVNELKVIYSEMGINIWEVIEAAKTKPFGYMPFYPGPGLGGHCIPIDPFYLTWKAREFGLSTRFIELAGEINTAMPLRVVSQLHRALDERFSKGLNGAKILLIGVAYKKNVGDMRESPALKLIELIEARGGSADFYDTYVGTIPPTREHPSLTGRQSVGLAPAALAEYDAVVIATDHDGTDYELITKHAPLIVDTRNACASAGADMTNVVLA